MKLDARDVSQEYILNSHKLSNCFAQLAMHHIAFIESTDKSDSTSFIFNIVDSLLAETHLFAYINQNCKIDLIDALLMYKVQYIKAKIEKHDYELNIKKLDFLISHLSNNNIRKIDGLTQNEERSIQEAVIEMLKSSKSLISRQMYGLKEYDFMIQANAIIFAVSASPESQRNLLNKLLLVKEIWSVSEESSIELINLAKSLYSKSSTVLSKLLVDDIDVSFFNIISFFVTNNNIIQTLTALQLLHLYDRLKDLDINDQVIEKLLHDIHAEASLRYNVNKNSEAVYELLGRFQTFDIILSQIENAEFLITQAYLLHNKDFLCETLHVIEQHIEHIKVLNCAKLSVIQNVLNKLESHLQKEVNRTEEILLFKIIKSNFENVVDSNITYKYSGLSRFAINSIRDKYFSLFTHIKILIEDEDNIDRNFLSETIIKKLAQDYYIVNAANSIEGLRELARKRKDVVEKLNCINFAELFSLERMNKINNLNMKKALTISKIKTSDEYIELLFKELIRQCNVAQLDSLYRPLLNKTFTYTHQVLKKLLKEEIKKRTGLIKLIYSHALGHKKEYNMLKNIKTSLYSERSEEEII